MITQSIIKEGNFPSRKKGGFFMLKSIVNTGLNARLTPEVYDRYAEEVTKLESDWKKSLEYLDSCNISFWGGIEDASIPHPVCQHDYPNIIYDYRECRVMDDTQSVPDGYKTIAMGGSVPCALMSIIGFYKHSRLTLSEIGKVLVENGYRTEDKGTLWIAIDKIPELVYGVRAEMLNHLLELCQQVSLGRPVMALVPASWLHDLPNMPSNECVTVWRLERKKVIVTTTSSHSIKELDLYDFLRHVKRAWAFYPI